jgi:hypothetical protein
LKFDVAKRVADEVAVEIDLNASNSLGRGDNERATGSISRRGTNEFSPGQGREYLAIRDRYRFYEVRHKTSRAGNAQG